MLVPQRARVFPSSAKGTIRHTMAARPSDLITEWIGKFGNVASFVILRRAGALLGQGSLCCAVGVGAVGCDGVEG
jgi:hypothetical protein